MRIGGLVLVVLALTGLGPEGVAHGASGPRVFDWAEMSRAGALPSTGVSTGMVDGRSVLRVVNDRDEPMQVRLLTVTDPGVTQRVYSVTGSIRYEGVAGAGYLEMWSCFPPAQSGGAELRFFSRTLGEGGPMGKLAGRSDWREFELRFDRMDHPSPPSRLEINLQLGGRGVVDFGPMTLRGLGNHGGFSGADAGARGGPKPWWSGRTAGLIGGIAGGFMGTFAGVLGALAGAGRARSFVVASFATLIVLGLLLTIAGVVAAAMKQPQAVWFSLFLPGVLTVGLLPGGLGMVRRRYAEVELRRMLAADALKD